MFNFACFVHAVDHINGDANFSLLILNHFRLHSDINQQENASMPVPYHTIHEGPLLGDGFHNFSEFAPLLTMETPTSNVYPLPKSAQVSSFILQLKSVATNPHIEKVLSLHCAFCLEAKFSDKDKLGFMCYISGPIMTGISLFADCKIFPFLAPSRK